MVGGFFLKTEFAAINDGFAVQDGSDFVKYEIHVHVRLVYAAEVHVTAKGYVSGADGLFHLHGAMAILTGGVIGSKADFAEYVTVRLGLILSDKLGILRTIHQSAVLDY